MATTIPRFLLPGNTPLRTRRRVAHFARFRRPQRCDACRYASTTAPSSAKPRVLEKPARYNPPSHPARRNRPARRYAGPPLSQQDILMQKTKQYPQMMAPEGSFIHWFLTNRSIHLWITLGMLTTLGVSTFVLNFLHTSPYTHLLPPRGEFLSSPLAFVSQYLNVYKMHTVHISAEAAERRMKKVEDVQKRQEFRKAHGFDNGGFYGTNPAPPAETVDGQSPTAPVEPGTVLEPDGRGASGRNGSQEAHERSRRPVKKWLGIW